jgi:hypothetical protein
MFLSYQGILIPLVQTLQFFHVYATLPGVILVHCIFGIPLTALMFRSYFASVPSELLDACKIDGCGFFRIYRYLMLPISFPAFAVVLIWQFTTIWHPVAGADVRGPHRRPADDHRLPGARQVLHARPAGRIRQGLTPSHRCTRRWQMA